MDINVTIMDTTILVKLSGRLDSSSAPQLEREINPQLVGITSLTLDCTELLYISSSGLRVVLSLKKKMNSANGILVIQNPNEMVMDVFEATGFVEILDVQYSE